MSLTTYRKKRQFDRTPEPKGHTTGKHALRRFVIQKHAATRLHYDFRLEMEGVLKSWAVPKGPSLDPADKRLAIQVEDHPFDYRTFEGIIPKGNYGAGTVMVWDEGTYEPAWEVEPKDAEQQLLDELKRGRLHIILHGQKLNGEFTLVRLKDANGTQWLLMKNKDEYASTASVLDQDRSVTTHRTLDEIKANAPTRKKKSKRAATRKKKRRTNMPHKIRPMLASLVAEPFDRDGWYFEVKWDGYRAIAEVEQGDVKLYSRNHLSFETKFAPIVESLSQLDHDVVLDGEVVVLDPRGRSQFQLLQQYQKTGKGLLAYYVFDLLYIDGKDLRNEPLRVRKQHLNKLLKGQSNLRVSEHIERNGVPFFQTAVEHGIEGIIAKDAKSLYVDGARSHSWLKIKARKQQEAVIGGFTEPRGSRQGIGSLVLGVYEGSDLVYIGHAGGGFDTKGLLDIRKRLEALEQTACPFKTKPKANAPVHWVKPILVCEVTFQEWTEDGTMRQPIFLGLREDKSARAVKREIAEPAAPANGALPQGKYTNLDKVFWPDEGYTKGDVIRYYRDVAPFILPHLRDRPLSLNRHPNGIPGKNFFQKDVSQLHLPEWAKTVRIDSETRGETIKYLLCQNEETLLYIANLGCIEINAWNSRAASLEHPDFLIIDLDPNEVPFARVIEAAQVVRKFLEKVCGECHCKTSGKRGLHVMVPLGARYDYDQVRQYAEVVARLIHEKLPKTTSVVRMPAQRRGKIYLDYLQNRRGQTMAAPYSLRPIEGALVSTPLKWSEVTKRLDPARFNIKTIQRRLDKVGDLWQPMLGPGVELQMPGEAG